MPLKMNPEKNGTVNGFWMPTIVADCGVPFNRETILKTFKENNIDGRVFFWPLSMLSMFDKRPNEVSYNLYMRALNLPSYHDINNEELGRVVKLIRCFFGK